MGTIHSMRQSWPVNNLIDFAVQSIQRAQADDSPFYHLRFDRVFPDDFYAAMLEAMPVGDGGYRALSGKAKLRNVTPEGKPTRTKIDLFPEHIRHLAPDNSTQQIGTIFHEALPNGKKPKKVQMLFSPNTGYAFAVADNTWHSVGLVGPDVKTRDSILLTYFVDAGAWRFLRNRGRRLQNVLLNELRSLKRN